MSDEQERDEARDIFPEATKNARTTSSLATGLRNRPLGRAATFAEPAPRFAHRGSSFVSESLSESRRSLRESTDDLFLPRAKADNNDKLETSNWHSVPLALALLPAVGGLLFQGGSAFVTDLTLLGLAAVFLNWALRMPWEWYELAQAVVIESEPFEYDEAVDDVNVEATSAETSNGSPSPRNRSSHIQRAGNELRVHELLALIACLVFPALGAWLLHAIRSQLTRPSESLISDYNLTIFLLASEVRPLRHLIKLVQRRTLFLQNTIRTNAEAKSTENNPLIGDLVARLEDMEARMANTILQSTHAEATGPPADELINQASSRANEELRKTMQPEVDALNRAMRRYEKRTTTAAIQVETRLQELEKRLQDVVILAAATQRNADKHAGKYAAVLANWISACIVVPAQFAFHVLTWPQRMLNLAFQWLQIRLGLVSSASKSSTAKVSGRFDQPRRKSSKEKIKLPNGPK